ncbi:MAG TPA: lipocalin-like domain-containing protein [Xanthomonadales bacterium]|nr:lipocalin-like domain-containing protein [Xanthomonadales bacterium]
MPDRDARARLPGAWLLVSWQVFSEGQPEPAEPFGPNPKGLLQYTEDGWMNASICNADRPGLPGGTSPRKMPAEVLADAWRSYFNYAGRWRIEDDCVIHNVSLSLNPNMVGTEQIRRMRFTESTLTLTGIENVGQQQRRHVLLWQRALPQE